jgi:hypothetical protein
MKVLSLQVPVGCDVANASRRVEKYHRVVLPDDASMLVDIRKGTSDTEVKTKQTMFRKGRTFDKSPAVDPRDA